LINKSGDVRVSTGIDIAKCARRGSHEGHVKIMTNIFGFAEEKLAA
jgi:hypothetical protein